MAIAWPTAVLIAGVAAAGACVLFGVAVAAVAALRVKRHADALQAHPLIARAAAAPALGERITHDLEALTGLSVRAQAALEQLAVALHEVRLPQAIAALRVAGAAIRLLLSGR